MTALQHDAILEWVDAHRADVVGVAQSLVRIPSENKQPQGSEKACQMFVADYLRDIGCRVDVFTPDEVAGLAEHPEYWPGRDYSERPNVVGVLSESRSGAVGLAAGRRSLLFSGHIDVVPVVGQGKYGWWDATVEDGRLYGRGSNDMKGGIASYLMAARCVRELGINLNGDLILETVVDEEFGGANGTLACRLRGYNADAAILPEPNNMLISTAHRGGQQFRLFTFAEGVGMGFGETVLRDPSRRWATSRRWTDTTRSGSQTGRLREDVFPLMPFVMKAGELLPWGTGEAIPETAWVEFWIEIPPGVTKGQLQSELKAAVAGAVATTPTLQRVSTRWEERTRFLAGSSMRGDHPILGRLADNLHLVTGEPPASGPAPFACDGFVFNLLSPTPVVILGPRGANAHAPDEWVDVEDLVKLTKTYALTIADWLA
jgi:acetylornithine deacetylase